MLSSRLMARALSAMPKASMMNPLVSVPVRGVYAPGTEPKVFINKHTKVIV